MAITHSLNPGVGGLSVVKPWYRQMWPWILIALPMSAVIASFITMYLAIVTKDSMVVDDYYKEGKAINQRIQRDVQAAHAGVTATLSTAGSSAVELNLQAVDASDFSMPATLTVRWVHVTDSSRDETVRFDRVRDGVYRGLAAWPTEGRWRVHVEDPAGAWRLVSPVWHPDGLAPLLIEPRAQFARSGNAAGVNEAPR